MNEAIGSTGSQVLSLDITTHCTDQNKYNEMVILCYNNTVIKVPSK